MLEDLQVLEGLIENEYAYADRHTDPHDRLAALRTSLPRSASTVEFGSMLQEVLASFKDGHTGVRGLSRFMGESGLLPLHFVAWRGRVVVLSSDTRKLVDPARPFLAAVNGVAVDTLLAEALRSIAFANPMTAVGVAAERLRYCSFLIERRTGRRAPFFDLQLTDTLGTTREVRVAPLPGGSSARADDGPVQHHAFRMLEDSIGLLRIPTFRDPPDKEEIARLAERLMETRGLVIDVRGNGGGSRTFLWHLAPYFIDAPLVVNAAVFRTNAEQHPVEGYLMDRYLFPPGSGYLLAEEEAAIERFIQGFRPGWEPARDKFSPWHYMVISPATGPPYRHPVVVLQDARCFSATDVFCSAFGQMDQVTLAGTTTGGGSGRPITHELPNSKLAVRLSSMVSFQASGELFEGTGVKPDLEVLPAWSDVTGGTDSQLRAAIDHIRAQWP